METEKQNISVLLEKHNITVKQIETPPKDAFKEENVQNLNKKVVSEWVPETKQDKLLIKKKRRNCSSS